MKNQVKWCAELLLHFVITGKARYAYASIIGKRQLCETETSGWVTRQCTDPEYILITGLYDECDVSLASLTTKNFIKSVNAMDAAFM
jgi:hypothetical protein